jgi:hypothetical protein
MNLNQNIADDRLGFPKRFATNRQRREKKEANQKLYTQSQNAKSMHFAFFSTLASWHR